MSERENGHKGVVVGEVIKPSPYDPYAEQIKFRNKKEIRKETRKRRIRTAVRRGAGTLAAAVLVGGSSWGALKITENRNRDRTHVYVGSDVPSRIVERNQPIRIVQEKPKAGRFADVREMLNERLKKGRNITVVKDLPLAIVNGHIHAYWSPTSARGDVAVEIPEGTYTLNNVPFVPGEEAIPGNENSRYYFMIDAKTVNSDLEGYLYINKSVFDPNSLEKIFDDFNNTIETTSAGFNQGQLFINLPGQIKPVPAGTFNAGLT